MKKLVALITTFLMSATVFAQKNKTVIRIAEIEIYPEYISAYSSILKENTEASLRLEKGVIAIFPMALKSDSTQFRVFEIYADQTAYENHRKTDHFQKYKSSSAKMVKALKLVDMNAIDEESMAKIFIKQSL